MAAIGTSRGTMTNEPPTYANVNYTDGEGEDPGAYPTIDDKIKKAIEVTTTGLAEYRSPAVMWTGGKDSTLVLYFIKEVAAEYDGAADGRVTPWATTPLDVGIRSTHWTEVFFNLQQDSGFRDATRLLMLATLPDHADFLLENPGGGNWISMTQRGALTVGLGFPEFRDAEHWKTNALATIYENAEQTVYPDGAQTELTAAYHMVPLVRFDAMADLLRQAGEPVPAAFQDTIIRMWNYIARVVHPDGRRPMNNDSGTEDHTRQLIRTAERYDRPDWLYIATNGQRGERPAGPPSDFHPWAGQLISRSGYDEDAH